LRQVGRLAFGALPPKVQRRVRASRGRRGLRPVTLAALDTELARAAELFLTDEDRARAFLSGFELEVPDDRPADPFSDEYRDWAWALYGAISGRAGYTTANEDSPIDVERAVTRPYPFQTGSATVVGDDLVARGFVLRCVGDPALGLAPPARVVEFGPGWGNLTLDLAATGFDVTAVDVSAQFCALVRARAGDAPGVHVVNADMLAFEPGERFDAAVFYESFHHCADHLAMLRKLHDVVRPGGVLLFAAEPVRDRMPYPWGPRLDGISLWSTRTYGWLELGFDRSYFAAALARTGWAGELRVLDDRVEGTADVIVARAVG